MPSKRKAKNPFSPTRGGGGGRRRVAEQIVIVLHNYGLVPAIVTDMWGVQEIQTIIGTSGDTETHIKSIADRLGADIRKRFKSKATILSFPKWSKGRGILQLWVMEGRKENVEGLKRMIGLIEGKEPNPKSKMKNPLFGSRVTKIIRPMGSREPLYYNLGNKYGWAEWVNSKATWASQEDMDQGAAPIVVVYTFRNLKGETFKADVNDLPRNWKHRETKWKSDIKPWQPSYDRKSAKERREVLEDIMRLGPKKSAEKYGYWDSKNQRWVKPSSNPSRKKTAKKSGAIQTIASCQKLWEYYCDRPSKKRLQEVFEHLDEMKRSTSKKVQEERRRCLRVAKLEAKRLKMKINPGKRAGKAIAEGFGAPESSHGLLESIHEFKTETRRQRKAFAEQTRKEREAAKRRTNTKTYIPKKSR